MLAASLRYCALLCCGGLRLVAQPAIGQNGVVNRASLIPPTLAGGAIARGAAFTIHGVRFGSSAVVAILKDDIATPVRVLSVEPERIEALMPETAPAGVGSLVVRVGAKASKPVPIEITASNPGIFTQNKKGWGPGEIENIEPRGKRVLNSTANPAQPGQRVVMRITGLGRGTPATVVVGSRTATAVMSKEALEAGGQEISFAVPDDAPVGCYVPVYMPATPARASNVATMAIHPGSGPCDAGAVPLLNGKRIGVVVIGRGAILSQGDVYNGDEALGLFIAKSEGPALSPLWLVPPPGTCTAYTGSFQAATILPTSISGALIAELKGDGLAAGKELTVTRENQRRSMPQDRVAAGSYRVQFDPLFLEPGQFVVSGAGGMDVGPFRVAFEGPSPFEWTNRRQTYDIDRSIPLALQWRGQPEDHLTILMATNVDQVTTAIGTCLCTAPLQATHFEIPPALLANIPASPAGAGLPYDQLFVVSLGRKATPFAAAGLEAGAIVTIYANGRFVKYH